MLEVRSWMTERDLRHLSDEISRYIAHDDRPARFPCTMMENREADNAELRRARNTGEYADWLLFERDRRTGRGKAIAGDPQSPELAFEAAARRCPLNGLLPDIAAFVERDGPFEARFERESFWRRIDP